MAKRKTLEAQEEFLTMRARGQSLRMCASKLHISLSTAHDWDVKNREKIQGYISGALHSFYVDYGFTRIDRVNLLGTMMKQIEELKSHSGGWQIKDWYRLFDIQLKVLQAMRAEYIPEPNSPVEAIEKELAAGVLPPPPPRGQAGGNTTSLQVYNVFHQRPTGEILPDPVTIDADAAPLGNDISGRRVRDAILERINSKAPAMLEGAGA